MVKATTTLYLDTLPSAEAGHGGHGAHQRVEEARPHRGPHVADGDGEARGRALLARVRGERQVRLGHAHRQLAETLSENMSINFHSNFHNIIDQIY